MALDTYGFPPLPCKEYTFECGFIGPPAMPMVGMCANDGKSWSMINVCMEGCHCQPGTPTVQAHCVC
jgi:hypothetical protein